VVYADIAVGPEVPGWALATPRGPGRRSSNEWACCRKGATQRARPVRRGLPFVYLILPLACWPVADCEDGRDDPQRRVELCDRRWCGWESAGCSPPASWSAWLIVDGPRFLLRRLVEYRPDGQADILAQRFVQAVNFYAGPYSARAASAWVNAHGVRWSPPEVGKRPGHTRRHRRRWHR
jgi:hypothetical protein